MLLSNTQVSRICKAFENGLSANIKPSKTHLHELGQSGKFLGKLLGPLPRTGLSLIKILLKSLAKRVLIPLALTASGSATDATFQKKMFESGTTALIISNEEMNDIMKI